MKQNAFTLAEVLITLSIIGIVAAMTLPTLTAKYNDKVLLNQIKRSYSITENAIKLYMATNECSDTLCMFDTSKTALEINKRLASVLKGAKVCEKNTPKNCEGYGVKAIRPFNNGYGILGYSNSMFSPKILLSDGSQIKVQQSNECPRELVTNVKDENGNFIVDSDGNFVTKIILDRNCAVLYLDVNGPKGPNQSGADVFSFIIMVDGTIDKDTISKVLLTEKFEYVPYNVGDPVKK